MPRGRPRKNPLPEESVKIQEDLANKKEACLVGSNTEALNTETNKKEKTEKGQSVEGTEMVPEQFSHLTYSQYQKLPECDRCHCKMLTDGRNINLTYLTAMAPWHREVSLDRVRLCDSCCHELNNMIDNWLINNGNGIKRKFSTT